MTFLQKFLFSGGVAFATLVLPSCNGFGGGADLVNPTQAELDAADVRWGLKARQARGGPRRTVMYEDTGSSGGSSGAANSPAPADTAPVQAPDPTPAPPPIADPALDQSTINKLR
jgi:hypothetical protein